MWFYQLRPETIPCVHFAHTFETKHYCLHFDTHPDFIEMTFIENGDVITRYDDGETEYLPSPGIFLQFKDRPVTCMSEAPLHRHSTIGISMKYSVSRIEQKNISNVIGAGLQSTLCSPFSIVPDYLPQSESDLSLEKLFKKTVDTYTAKDFGYTMDCSGTVLKILAEISRELLQSIITENRKLQPGSILYCRRAMNYISAHIDEKITVENISSFLGISCGYLSRIFRAYTGQTLIEHINYAKLNKIKGLIMDTGLTLREAGESVGIEDEHYLSRIFKKYLGINARNLKVYRLKNEDVQ